MAKLTHQQSKDLLDFIGHCNQAGYNDPQKPDRWSYGEFRDDVLRICSIAKSLHHLAECQCNYGLTQRQETRQANLEEEAAEIAHRLGCLSLDHNHDPRGYALYVHFADEAYNSWGGSETGYGVPEL